MRLLKSFFLLLLVLAVVLTGGYYYWRHQLDAPIALSQPEIYEVRPGDGARATLARLESRGVIAEQWPFKLLGLVEPERLTGLRVGEFMLEPGMSGRELLAKLSSNDVVTYTVTIPEGRTFAQMRGLLDAAPKLEHQSAGLDDEALMEALGYAGEHPEGRFFPATYRYRKGDSDLELFSQAYRLMSRELERAWASRVEGLPYDDPYQALIMASLIEQETGAPEERREIAGVFVRRLERGMRLQTDPTVVYGLGMVSGQGLTRRDLAADNPYNTYRIDGLPPTPIALPGRASIEAALDPAPGDTYYFVAMGNGRHRFSRTLAEHNAAVQRYIRDRRGAAQEGDAPPLGSGAGVTESAGEQTP